MADRSDWTVWNIRLSTGKVVSKIIGPERPTLENGGLLEGQKLVSGPYPDIKTAMSRERADLWYPHLLRAALERGIIRRNGQHYKPTLQDVSDWTGYSVDTLRAWMKPVTSRSRRKMPRQAIRLILWEFKAHDENSRYNWDVLLRQCR